MARADGQGVHTTAATDGDSTSVDDADAGKTAADGDSTVAALLTRFRAAPLRTGRRLKGAPRRLRRGFILWWTLLARELDSVAQVLRRVPKLAYAAGGVPLVLLTYLFLNFVQNAFYSQLDLDASAVGLSRETVMDQPLASFLLVLLILLVVAAVAVIGVAALMSLVGVWIHKELALPTDPAARKRAIHAAAAQSGDSAVGPATVVIALLILGTLGVVYRGDAAASGRLVAKGHAFTGEGTIGFVEAEALRVTVVKAPKTPADDLSPTDISDCMLYLGRNSAGSVLFDVEHQRAVTLPASDYSLAVLHEERRVEDRCLRGEPRPT